MKQPIDSSSWSGRSQSLPSCPLRLRRQDPFRFRVAPLPLPTNADPAQERRQDQRQPEQRSDAELKARPLHAISLLPCGRWGQQKGQQPYQREVIVTDAARKPLRTPLARMGPEKLCGFLRGAMPPPRDPLAFQWRANRGRSCDCSCHRLADSHKLAPNKPRMEAWP